MKINKNTIWSFILLVAIASLYRIIPNRMFGFAPQIAMAVFAGSIIKEKKYAFLLPLASMLFSDIIYQILYVNHLTTIQGFYNGQALNYIILCSLTVVGFFVNKNKISSILSGALIGPTAYFIISNFFSWTSGLDINNQHYAKSWAGIVYCYTEALPFFKASIFASVIFSAILFGVYYLIQNISAKKVFA